MNPSPRIAFVTSSWMPKPDPETHLLIHEMESLGVHPSLVSWDAALDWSLFDLVLIRTTWDYFVRLPEFLAWVKSVEEISRLRNSRAIIEWNAHKAYLLGLEEAGVAVVPTTILQQGDLSAAAVLLARFGGEDVVVKPAVSGGAIGALRERADDPRTEQHARELLADGDVLIQPFVPSVGTEGESSLVYFNGVFSHSIRKLPAQGDFRVQDNHGGTIHPHTPSPAELDLAAAAIACAPLLPLYARVDIVRFEDAPVVMELEVIEPELFLTRSPEATARFAKLLLREVTMDNG